MSVTGALVLEGRSKWRAPARDGETLVDPPIGGLADTIAANRKLAWPMDDRLEGISARELRALARRELLEAAWNHSLRYRDVHLDRHSTGPLILSGHQPELVHLGVWFKHFVLHEAARRVGGIGIHLSIDNDTAKRTSIMVPTGSLNHPGLTTLAYDRRATGIPYEERKIEDRAAWSSFGHRVERAIEGLVDHPMIREYWPRVLRQSTERVGEAIATARHQTEEQFGLQTLETPLSSVCRGQAFSWFVAMMLADFESLWSAYNRALREYRVVHRLKSSQHPAPDLQQIDEWWEIPLWIWTADQPIRRRCYVRRVGNDVGLTDRHGLECRIPQGKEIASSAGASALHELTCRGIRLRPRALTTTLYARWIAADLFIHGIGGAAYDEVTHQIARAWWGVPAPTLMVATATFRLPVPIPDVSSEDLRRIDQRLRELEFHPELFLSADQADADRWVRQKRDWIAQDLPRGQRRERHRRIVEANRKLQPLVASLRGRLLEERERIEQMLRHRQVLASREYAFCLFPERYAEKLAQAAQIEPSRTVEPMCEAAGERPPCR